MDAGLSGYGGNRFVGAQGHGFIQQPGIHGGKRGSVRYGGEVLAGPLRVRNGQAVDLNQIRSI
ncbi:hypothetical protein C8R44DRAFT_774175 [Mycena epipterygia]|nr:hypothetical protein C8R44DRAFT_774175 [Mycena epipterygia]